MKKVKFELTKKNIIVASAIIILLIAAAYFFMPRNLGDIANCPDKVLSISISEFRGGYNDTSKEFITLEGEEAQAFLESIRSTKVYISPFHTKLGEGGAVTLAKNITFEVKKTAGSQSPKSIYVFTDRILIIDGKQYTLYGNAFISEFLSIVNEQT